MSFLEWYAQASRNFACTVDNLVPSLLEELYGSQVAQGYYSALGIFAPSPCEVPPPVLPPGNQTFPNPACPAATIAEIDISRGAPFNDLLTVAFDGYPGGSPFPVPGNGWFLSVVPFAGGAASDRQISLTGSDVPHTITDVRYFPPAGQSCGNPPRPGGTPPNFPAFPPSTPITVTPPAPLPQIPLSLSWQIHAPVSLANNLSVQIPVTGIIDIANNFSMPIHVPFTFNLPDFNVDFSPAFNPQFTLMNFNGQLRNWPPPSLGRPIASTLTISALVQIGTWSALISSTRTSPAPSCWAIC